MVAWGLWAALADVATRSIPPEVAMIVSYLTGVAVAGVYVVGADRPVELAGEGVAIAAIAGAFAGAGAVAFYAGLAAGRTAVVTTISALYFVVAAFVGVAVLGESLGVREILGVLFAVVAVVLLSS